MKKNDIQTKEGILWAWHNQHPTIKWWLVISSSCYLLGSVFLMNSL